MLKSAIIDIHAHLYPEGCFSHALESGTDFKLVNNPRGQSLLYRDSHVMSVPAGQDVEARLASMDGAGIDMAVLSVGALNIGWARAREQAAARAVNEGLAEVCRRRSSRFRFVAVLPCTSRSEMIQELDRALDLGASGVGITTRIGDFQLQAPEVRHFWEEMQRRKLMVLVHPTFPCGEGPQNDPGTFLSVGYPGETAMAATQLALAGVLAECPDVKIVWSHLGGSLPMVLDRIDRGYQRYSSCPHPPSFYLRRCYFDTACTHPPALDCARGTWGADRLVFGTDVPHVPNTEKQTIAALRSTGWPLSDLENIFNGTARTWMA